MAAADNVVRVEGGLISGTPSADGALRVFRGIPFAKPPVAELRWKPPQPAEPWTGVRSATSFGPRCVQVPRPKASLGYFPPEPESEDCLYLNIWAPADTERRPHPVMVWIYGGACNMGSGALPIFHGEALARKGVVLVTFNYRLGRLGFLAHPELTAESGHGASGNYGLMDQRAALQWVQRNIDQFGGDPGRVTIFGQSTGSFSVSYFMASPLTKSLFHRAIGQSGGGFGPVDTTTGTSDAIQGLPDAERSGVELSRRIGAASIAELRARCAHEIQMARIGDGYQPGQGYDRFKALNGRGAFDNAYFIVDGYFIPDTVRSIFARGAQNDVPLIAGSNAQERGTTVQPASTRQGYIDAARAQYRDLADRFLQVYPSESDAESNEAGGLSIGDRIFTWQSWTWANAQSRTGKSPAYYYRFSRVPPFPPGVAFTENPNNVPRSFHGAEIPYVFGSLSAREWPWEPLDHALSDTMTSYWVNFAETGDPNGSGLARWPKLDPAAPMAMHFGIESGLGPVPHPERLAFWDSFYERQPKSMAEYLARRAAAQQ